MISGVFFFVIPWACYLIFIFIPFWWFLIIIFSFSITIVSFWFISWVVSAFIAIFSTSPPVLFSFWSFNPITTFFSYCTPIISFLPIFITFPYATYPLLPFSLLQLSFVILISISIAFSDRILQSLILPLCFDSISVAFILPVLSFILVIAFSFQFLLYSYAFAPNSHDPTQ